MAGLQRSAVSFRRQGSSGMVWDDKFLSELNQISRQKEEQDQLESEQQDSQPLQAPEHEKTDINSSSSIIKPSISINTAATTIERSRSNGGGRAYRTGRVSPAIEPPSPRVSACGFCSGFAKPSKTLKKKSGKRRSR